MKLVLIPPHADATADWPQRLMSEVPGLTVTRRGPGDSHVSDEDLTAL